MFESLEEFEKVEDQIRKALEEAIYQTLISMGDKVKGISWFCSNSEFYNLEQARSDES